MARLHVLGIVCAAVSVASTAGAEPRLEALDRGKLGLDSLLAHDAENDLYTRVIASLGGGFLRRGVFAPDAGGDLEVGLGVFDDPRTTFDLGVDLQLGWPVIDATGAEPDRGMPAAAGRVRSRGAFALELPDAAHLELEVAGSAETAIDGERSQRPRDVGPAPYRVLELAPEAWVTWPSGPDDDDDQFGVGMGGTVRRIDYLGPDVPDSQQLLRAFFAAGLRDRDDEARGDVRFGEIGVRKWSRPGVEDVNAVDMALRGSFQLGNHARADSGGTASVRFDAGWVFFLRDPLAPEDAPLVHTADMGADVAVTDLEIGSIGGSIRHQPDMTPAGAPIGVTSFELAGGLAPQGEAWGGAVSIGAARVVDLAGGAEDVWTFEMGGELYARFSVVELGVDGGGGRGAPNGSMGWDPFAAEPGWWGRGGGFARIRAEWFEPGSED
jgi:hypothetical protein